ncbi:cytochrome c1 [Niveibacterium terrae]|uniref:cytochrome c1 n=1 Tax=Niveibacterium terrae TaxID=3373598 RepID=UPI003A91F4E3
MRFATGMLCAALAVWAACASAGDGEEARRRGAKLYLSRCLACHDLSLVRGESLAKLGLGEAEIRGALGPGAASPMRAALGREQVKQTLGALPPDLSLAARSRASADLSGEEWLARYLQGFTPDPARPSGWNNALVPNTAMPDALGGGGEEGGMPRRDAADIAAFLGWAAEPGRAGREALAWPVLGVLTVFAFLCYALMRTWRKDVS